MGSDAGSLVLIGFVFIWLITLSILVFRFTSHYNRLTRGVTTSGLRDVLEALLASQQTGESRLRLLDGDLERVQTEGKLHIARIGIVRFNPFSDTGGAQSFSLAILDSIDNGIVMTSLYARNGNRWYIKEISSGKGNGVELSKEEESAIKKAAKRA